MQRDERDLLDVVKGELEFLEKGGYARTPGTSWRPVFIFEDSPICVNHDYEVNPASCSDCALIQLIPREFRFAKVPCRHIPLNAEGETLDLLYRYAGEHEIEEAVRRWLQATIARLEEQRETQLHAGCECVPLSGKGKQGTALLEAAKCANPACPVSFDWRNGGKFFRFRQASGAGTQDAANEGPVGIQGVRHFWLCERCAHIFTLGYKENSGVMLRVRPELADPDIENALTADGVRGSRSAA